MNRNAVFFIIFLALVGLACGRTTPRKLNLYPTSTASASQTPFVIQITNTPENTPTPAVVIVVQTSTQPSNRLCVIADQSVYLRPSPDMNNYPILPLSKGSEVFTDGSRDGDWLFVSYKNKQGWVKSDWLSVCQ